MITTRFAPSPTGFLHIGGLKMALYCYALAKKHNGKFILRIEDTDRSRLVEGAEEEIKVLLEEFGFHYDEFYKQSERLDLYNQYATQLVEQGDAYYCFMTKEELEESRKSHNGKRTVFRSKYRDLPLKEAQKLIADGKEYVIRQKMPKNEIIKFVDPVQGEMNFNSDDIDEGVLLKADKFPTYHLAMAVDDHLMGITHVFRGVEWIPSVPKHVLLYKALKWDMPDIIHLSVLLDPNGGKLSKRFGTVSVREFLKSGYIKEAILNFLMLLGWSTPEKHDFGEKENEFFTLEEFINLFEIKDINKASPIFNRDKLLWFNQSYLQKLNIDEYTERFFNWVKKYDEGNLSKYNSIDREKFQKILLLEQPRAKIFGEIENAINFYFEHKGNFNFSECKQTKKLTSDDIQKFLVEFMAFFDSWNDFNHEDWEAFIRNYAEKNELKAGSLFMLLRVIITDSQCSPPLLEVMEIIGKMECMDRIKKYIK